MLEVHEGADCDRVAYLERLLRDTAGQDEMQAESGIVLLRCVLLRGLPGHDRSDQVRICATVGDRDTCGEGSYV